jgi:hypothetical protein
MNDKNNIVRSLFIEKVEYPVRYYEIIYEFNLSSYVGILTLYCKLKKKYY